MVITREVSLSSQPPCNSVSEAVSLTSDRAESWKRHMGSKLGLYNETSERPWTHRLSELSWLIMPHIKTEKIMFCMIPL